MTVPAVSRSPKVCRLAISAVHHVNVGFASPLRERLRPPDSIADALELLTPRIPQAMLEQAGDRNLAHTCRFRRRKMLAEDEVDILRGARHTIGEPRDLLLGHVKLSGAR